MKQAAKTTALIACAILLLAMSYTLGYQRSESRYDEGDRKLWEAREIIRAYFVGEYDDDALLDCAVDGMVASLGDEWSYYVPRGDYADYRDELENEFVGVGVSVSVEEDGTLLVEGVTDGGSAGEQGVVRGDRIVGVEGERLQVASLAEARGLISGEAGTRVRLTIRRADGTETELELERRRLFTPPVSWELLAPDAGYIRIENFDAGAAEGFRQAVEELTAQGARGLVCDVRDDPGGALDELVAMLDLLLPAQTVIILRDSLGAEELFTSDEACVEIPVAVVVNEYAYSAAEFFAAALQEAGRAPVVGIKTYGKGYSQVPFDLSDGSALAISAYSYCTAEGKSLAGVGITPDVTLPLTEEEEARYVAFELPPAEDPQVRAAALALGIELEQAA